MRDLQRAQLFQVNPFRVILLLFLFCVKTLWLSFETQNQHSNDDFSRTILVTMKQERFECTHTHILLHLKYGIVHAKLSLLNQNKTKKHISVAKFVRTFQNFPEFELKFIFHWSFYILRTILVQRFWLWKFKRLLLLFVWWRWRISYVCVHVMCLCGKYMNETERAEWRYFAWQRYHKNPFNCLKCYHIRFAQKPSHN